MDFLSFLVQFCVISRSITYVNSYVLFAANVEDFKRIAEKLGSEKLMNQLLQIANNPAIESFKNNYARADREDSRVHSQERKRHMRKPVARQREPKSSLSLNDGGTKIDFEELVERVRQRLENEFKNKYKSQAVEENIRDTNTKTVITKAYIPMRPKKKAIHKANLHLKSTVKTTKDSQINDEIDYDYAEAIPQTENQSHERIRVKIEANNPEPVYADAMVYETEKPESKPIAVKYELVNNSNIYYDNVYDYETEHKTANTQDVLPYQQIQMVKDDSYGDYITPAKEKNIYVSSEKTTALNRYKIQNNRLKISTDYKTQTETNDYVQAVTIGSGEIKARTEKLWYDDDTRILSEERVKGTGVPTRETYKIVTPNYYASLPTVAERYDFNEPLPERDRERENVKYFGNPPARINKKIRL